MSTLETIPGAGRTGGDVLQVTGYERVTFEHLMVPFDPTRPYRVAVRIRNTVRPSNTDRNKVRVGVEGLAVDGETLVGVGGSNGVGDQYFVAAEYLDLQATALDTWVECVGYILGQGTYVPNANAPGNPSGVDPAVAYLYPVVWVNCTDGDGTVQIDAVVLDSGAVSTDTAAVNAVPSQAVSQFVQVDPGLVENLSYAGRTGFFDVASVVTPSFGKILSLWPVDGKMYRANLYDAYANGFMAVDLGLGTGIQKLALPGTIIRDDALSLLPGREIFLGGMASGMIDQTEPASGQLRLVLGRALTETTWYFNPQPQITQALDVPFTARYIWTFEESFNALIEWGNYLYAGCGNATIYRSGDYGLTWSKVYEGSGGTFANVNAFVVMGSSLYAVMDRGSNSHIQCLRTTNGTTWNAANVSTEPYGMDIAKQAGSNLLIIGTGNPSGYAKIYTSPDGITWTLRLTHGTEDTVVRLATFGTSYNFAAVGYWTARTLYSTNGTSWLARNNYTGYTSPSDLACYKAAANDTWYSCCMVWDAGIIYGGTGTMSTAEITDPNILWETFFVYEGDLYAIGSLMGIYNQIWKRQLTYNGSAWVASWVKVMESSNISSWRMIKASNGNYYFCSYWDNSLYRLTKKNYVLI